MQAKHVFAYHGSRAWGNNVLFFHSLKISQISFSAEKFWHQSCLYGSVVFTLALALNAASRLLTLCWSDETLNGLSLVPLLTGVLIYQRRETFQRLTLNICWPSYIASLCFGIFAWWVLEGGSIRIGGLLFVVTLGIIFASFFGKASITVIGGPLLFLCMTIPTSPNFIEMATLGLQHIFSLALDLLGPLIDTSYVGRDDFTLRFIEGKNLVVISAECSGLRSMMGMVIMAGYFSISDRLSLGKTVVMICAAVSLALALNLIRIIITIELYLHNLQDYAVGKWHGLLGISVCLIGFILLSKLSEKLQ